MFSSPVFQSFCSQGGGDGHVWWGHAWPGGMHGGGHAWWGACMVGGMHGRGACVAGGMYGGGACVAGGKHDRECVWWGVCMVLGHTWQGENVINNIAWWGGGACMAGETATAADGRHPSGMHSCLS